MNSKHFDRTAVVWAAAIVAIVMATIVAGPARAQDGRGRITVTVRDNTGVIPGATVTATSTATSTTTAKSTPTTPRAAGTPPANGPVMSALTDSQGVAVLDGLIAGSYDVRVTFPGFADATRNNVGVTAGQPQSIDVTLTLPQFSSEVTVTAYQVWYAQVHKRIALTSRWIWIFAERQAFRPAQGRLREGDGPRPARCRPSSSHPA